MNGQTDQPQADNAQIEQLLAQLSPEEQAQLLQELEGGAGAPPVDQLSPEEQQALQMISQLPPEQQAQLLQELEQQAGAGAGGELSPEEQQAASMLQNPELSKLSHEIAKAVSQTIGADALVKSAAYTDEGFHNVLQPDYVHGFVGRALMGGYTIKQAVDMYENAIEIAAERTAGTNEKTAAAVESYVGGMYKRAAELGIDQETATNLISRLIS